MALILSILLSKLKTHMVRKRERDTVKIDSKTKITLKMVYRVLKIYSSLGETKRVKFLKEKKQRIVWCDGTHL